jgi:hypothetical protein
MSQESHEIRYPAKCSECGSTRAMLKSATTVQGYPEIIRVDIRCAACGYNWTLYTRHSDPPI